MQAIDYRITTEYIELNQLLKICGLAASGGAGGALVTEGNVTVNGQQELRKRCKIRPGHVVQLGDMRITVLAPDPTEVAAKAEAKVAIARDEAAKRKLEAAKPKAAAPWGVTPAGKPRTGAKQGKARVNQPNAPKPKSNKTGNLFAAKAEEHGRRRKP